MNRVKLSRLVWKIRYDHQYDVLEVRLQERVGIINVFYFLVGSKSIGRYSKTLNPANVRSHILALKEEILVKFLRDRGVCQLMERAIKEESGRVTDLELKGAISVLEQRKKKNDEEDMEETGKDRPIQD